MSLNLEYSRQIFTDLSEWSCYVNTKKVLTQHKIHVPPPYSFQFHIITLHSVPYLSAIIMNEWMNEWINEWINQSINHSFNQSINQLINQSINQLINRSFNQSTNWSTNQSVNLRNWAWSRGPYALTYAYLRFCPRANLRRAYLRAWGLKNQDQFQFNYAFIQVYFNKNT